MNSVILKFLYGNHYGMEINRATIRAFAPSNFEGVKTDSQTDRIALHIVEFLKVYAYFILFF